jgi:hypothetical protein
VVVDGSPTRVLPSLGRVVAVATAAAAVVVVASSLSPLAIHHPKRPLVRGKVVAVGSAEIVAGGDRLLAPLTRMRR